MMSISKKVLLSVLPKGRIWQIVSGSYYDKFLDAIAVSLDTVKSFFDALQAQAIPGQATDAYLLREWCDLFRIDPDLSEVDRQTLAQTYYTTTGGSDLAYLDGQLAASGLLWLLHAVHSEDSQCGIDECGFSECGGNGSNIVVEYRGANKCVTRFTRTLPGNIPIPIGTIVQHSVNLVGYVTDYATSLDEPATYIDIPVTSITAGEIPVTVAGDQLDIAIPITGIATATVVQSVQALGQRNFSAIKKLVDGIKPATTTATYVPVVA